MLEDYNEEVASKEYFTADEIERLLEKGDKDDKADDAGPNEDVR